MYTMAIYYGIKATPKGKTRTNMEQSAKNGQLRRYGLYKVDASLVPQAVYNDMVDRNITAKDRKKALKELKDAKNRRIAAEESALERQKIERGFILNPEIIAAAKRRKVVRQSEALDRIGHYQTLSEINKQISPVAKQLKARKFQEALDRGQHYATQRVINKEIKGIVGVKKAKQIQKALDHAQHYETQRIINKQIGPVAKVFKKKKRSNKA